MSHLWRRILTALAGAVAVFASVAMAFARTGNAVATFAKWVFLPLLFLAGVALIVTALRGRARDGDDTTGHSQD